MLVVKTVQGGAAAVKIGQHPSLEVRILGNRFAEQFGPSGGPVRVGRDLDALQGPAGLIRGEPAVAHEAFGEFFHAGRQGR